MDLSAIKRFWEESGRTLDADAPVTATSRDPFLAEMERQNVLDHLKSTDRVLEVGCGIGTHTMHYAGATKSLVGLDIAPSLLDHARRAAAAKRIDNVEFIEGSVLDLSAHFKRGEFGVVVSQRCLINLPTWEHQLQALRQIAEVLRPGGLLVLTEGFQEEIDALNNVREKVGLEPIRVVDYNRNFRGDEFHAGIRDDYEIVARRDYGTYLLLSRVLHPLAVAPDPPRHDGSINRAAMQLSRAIASDGALAEYSYNLFYALKRH